MPKNLIIVESPAKCKTISKFLGKDYSIKATMGHIIDLPNKEFGVNIEQDFKPKYVVVKGKAKILKELKDEAAKSDVIYLAPDPDREGEAIAWHVAQHISKENNKIKRVLFNEITKQSVISAINNPCDIDLNKVNAQQARRILDRIVGYQISPILWRTVFKGLSAGRVQSVALRLICEREDEINKFVKKEYWSLHGIFEHNNCKFTARLISVDGQKPDLPTQESAKAIAESLKKSQFVVKDVSRQQKTRRPYAPFITSTLQQESARKLNFSAAKTMIIAQQLYEGLELGKLGSMGIITYMRTDSTRIANEALSSARAYISSAFGEKYLSTAPRIYTKNKNAQDAHEAIRPVQISQEFSPQNLKKYLSKDQYKLYEIIWKRFLASQMADAIYDSTKIDIGCQNCIFRASGSILRFDGFLILYDETSEETVENGEDINENLPDLSVNTYVTLNEFIEKQHFTQPPPRYTEASLVKELEEKGIGRPSTYAQIIDTLKKRKYVILENKKFVPTEVGRMVKDILVKEFSDIFDVNFTANMENDLDKIELGEAEWISVLKEFYEPFSKKITDVKSNIKSIKASNQTITNKICPECKKFPLVVKWSKNGKFLACQGFPSCRHTEPLEKQEETKTNEICDKCGSPMIILNINGNRFLGCSQYPKCKNTKSISIGVSCPLEGCNGKIVERTTKRNKIFYGCSNYPKCKFASWDKPVAQKCEKCGFGVLLYKESKRKGKYLKCYNCKAEFKLEEDNKQSA